MSMPAGDDGGAGGDSAQLADGSIGITCTRTEHEH
jgi:hypothetical protein